MYNNAYMQNYPINYGQQSLNDRIDNQIAQLNQMKEQLKSQQPAINQTFQLAPSHQNGVRYANTIDDVNKETVYSDTPFFSKDMSVLWIKNTKGDIKTYELIEIVAKDEKDLQIELLQTQINELRKEMSNNEWFNSNASTKQNATDTSTNDGAVGAATKKSKSTSIQEVSGGEKK